MRQSRKFSGPAVFCIAARAFGDFDDRLQRNDPPLGWAHLKEKRPAPKAFQHAFLRSRIGAEARRGRSSSRSVEENLHRPSLIAECRKFGKVRRRVFGVSTGMQIKRREASRAP
jgi:hypothetical protein